MVDELNEVIGEYQAKWQKLIGAQKAKAFFESLKPTAIGWKIAGYAEYARGNKVPDEIDEVKLIKIIGN